jgi:hypothetical protein
MVSEASVRNSATWYKTPEDIHNICVILKFYGGDIHLKLLDSFNIKPY